MSVLGRILFTGEAAPAVPPNTNYTILMWRYGQLTGRRYLTAYTGKRRNPWQDCSVTNCRIVYDDESLLGADAVVFHLHKVSR